MTPEVLQVLWQLMRQQRNRFNFEEDYVFIRDLSEAIDGIEERLDRYSIEVTFFDQTPATSVSDGVLGLYCWMQAAAMHIRAAAEREAELTKRPNL